jgi:hypothetical protein
MNRIAAVVFVIALLAPGRLMLTGQEPAKPSVFTAAQAEAGRTSYENSCGKCHAYSLLGRTGQEGELPPVSALPPAYQEFIRKTGRVPPFVGKTFLSRWGQKSAAELIARFQVTANDPFFQFEGMSDDVVVNITAYVLRMNGAKPGPEALTKTTAAVVNSIVE